MASPPPASPPPAPAPAPSTLHASVAAKIRVVLAAPVQSETQGAFLQRLREDIGLSVPVGALRWRSSGLTRELLKDFAARCGVPKEPVLPEGIMVKNACDVLAKNGFIIQGAAVNPEQEPICIDIDDVASGVISAKKFTAASQTVLSDEVGRQATKAVEPFLRWVLGVSGDDDMPAVETSNLYSPEISLGLKTSANCDRGTKLFPKDAIVESPLNPMYAVAINKANVLVGKAVQIVATDSERVVNVRVTKVETSKHATHEGQARDRTTVVIYGVTTPVKDAPAFPDDDGQRMMVLLDKTAAGVQGHGTSTKSVVFRTDAVDIGCCVRIASSESDALLSEIGLSVGQSGSAQNMGILVEKQDGGGEQACAPMAITRLAIETVKGADDHQPDKLIDGARILRDCASAFIKEPAVLSSWFSMFYRAAGPTGGEDTLASKARRAASVQVIGRLAEDGHIDAATWEAFLTPHLSAYELSEDHADVKAAAVIIHGNLVDDFVLAVDDIDPIGSAAAAVLALKREFDAHVDTSGAAIDLMSLMLSNAGILNVATVFSGSVSAYLRFAPGYRSDLQTGLLLWRKTGKKAGHYEAVTGADHNALEFVPSCVQNTLNTLVQMWAHKLKSGAKTISVAPPPPPKQKKKAGGSTPAAAKGAPAAASSTAAPAAKTGSASGAATTTSAASGAGSGEAAGGTFTPVLTKAQIKAAKAAAAKEKEEAEKLAAAKRAAFEEKTEAALDRAATKETVRAYVGEKFSRAPAIRTGVNRMIDTAYHAGCTPSFVRHALRTNTCVFGSQCRRRANGQCKYAHQPVPAAASTTAATSRPGSQTQHRDSQQQSGTAQFTVRVEGATPLYADMARATSQNSQQQNSQQQHSQQSTRDRNELQQLRLMVEQLQQQQQQQPQPPLQMYQPPLLLQAPAPAAPQVSPHELLAHVNATMAQLQTLAAGLISRR